MCIVLLCTGSNINNDVKTIAERIIGTDHNTRNIMQLSDADKISLLVELQIMSVFDVCSFRGPYSAWLETIRHAAWFALDPDRAVIEPVLVDDSAMSNTVIFIPSTPTTNAVASIPAIMSHLHLKSDLCAERVVAAEIRDDGVYTPGKPSIYHSYLSSRPRKT